MRNKLNKLTKWLRPGLERRHAVDDPRTRLVIGLERDDVMCVHTRIDSDLGGLVRGLRSDPVTKNQGDTCFLVVPQAFAKEQGLVPRLRRSDHLGLISQPCRAGLTFGDRPSGP